MSGLTTKEFNEIYKRNFKEYFDKSLKKDGFYKKGTINFYRVNSLGLIEGLNFQKHYEKLTINCYISTIYCESTKESISIGLRLGEFMNTQYDYWWDLTDEKIIKKSMSEMLELIQTKLYDWFKNLENEQNFIEKTFKSSNSQIKNYILQASTMAKFRRYNEILLYIEKVKNEYNKILSKRNVKEWETGAFEEALLLEEKLKEGTDSVDKYIIGREKQSLIEMGLEKLIK